MRAPKAEKKIMALSLEGSTPMQVVAKYTEERLVFIGAKRIQGDPAEWTSTIEKLIADRIEKDWVVIVEDRTDSFSDMAVLWDFGAIMSDGKTAMQQCLDWYFALYSRGAIVFPDSMQPFALRVQAEGSLIDMTNDDKGRLVYKVDWRRITCGHKAMLLCVAGAILEEPMSDRWLNKLFEIAQSQIVENANLALARRIQALTGGHTLALAQAYEARVKAKELKKEGARQ